MDSKIEQQPFTLTMLGTITDFTPELKQTAKPVPYTKGTQVKAYPKGETLSIVSSLIKTNRASKTPQADTQQPYPLATDDITVLNGPKTDGSNVGEKIALGLAALLKALAKGRTVLNLIAHSRGAVEAILIAHELEAIKTISSTCTTFAEVVNQLAEQQTQRYKKKPTNNTPDIIAPLKAQIALIPKEEQEQWYNTLKTNLPHASVNFFGIDPVPGDCFPITWYDERYFIIPEIIKNTELIYYANEHTDWGFTPILPVAAAKEKQNLVCYSMPGHHGTGSSGNNGSQQGVIVSPDGYKTTHVQKLMLYKLLNFLNKQAVVFNDGIQIFHQYSALGRKYAGNIVENPSIPVEGLDFPTILRLLYAEIAKNQLGYDAYDATHYSYMGLTKQRKILHPGHIYGLFNEVFTRYAGYVNEEHALLMQAYFFKLFGLDSPRKNAVDLINTASSVLEENIKKITHQVPSILDSENTRNKVTETFGIVMRLISQHYLTQDWSSLTKQKEKGVLHQALMNIISKFKELSASDNLLIQQFATELLLLIFNSINHTLILQAQGLEKDFNCLQESVDKRLTHFFSALLRQLNHLETNPQAIVEALVNCEEYKRLPNYPSTVKISYFYQQLASKGMEQYTLEQLIQSYEEQYTNTIEEFTRLYQQIQTFIQDLAALRQLIPNETITVDESDLLQKAKDLIAVAAERFYKDRPHALPPIGSTNEFMNLAERYAIAHFKLMDRHQELNKTPLKEDTSNVFVKTLSFFWSPVAKMLYGQHVASPIHTQTSITKDLGDSQMETQSNSLSATK